MKENKMLKNILYKFFTNLKWIWIPFVLLALFFLCSILTFYFGLKNTIEGFVLTTDGKISLTLANDFIKEELNKLKFQDNLSQALNNMFSFSWLKTTMQDFDKFIQDASLSSTQLETYNEIYREKIIFFFKLSLSFALIGIFLTNFISSFFIYRFNIKKKISQTILNKIIDTLLVSTSLSLIAGLISTYHFPSLLSISILLFITTAFYLFKSYLVFSKKKGDMNKTINLKNIFQAIFGQILLYIFSFIIIIPIYIFLGELITFLAYIPLFIYIESIIRISFDDYCLRVKKP